MAGHAATPTFGELGIEAPFVQWTGLVAPKGLPAERLAALRDAVARITADPVYRQLPTSSASKLSRAPRIRKAVRDEDRVFRAG